MRDDKNSPGNSCPRSKEKRKEGTAGFSFPEPPLFEGASGTVDGVSDYRAGKLLDSWLAQQ